MNSTLFNFNPHYKADPNEKEKGKEDHDPSDWDHEKDNCGINPEENPCGDANEY